MFLRPVWYGLACCLCRKGVRAVFTCDVPDVVIDDHRATPLFVMFGNVLGSVTVFVATWRIYVSQEEGDGDEL